ncbi:MAG: glycosyltransferase [Gammaproteobacteria bacterium]|nr:glycosyltransferase [Gammaproteobacteria bacterium]
MFPALGRMTAKHLSFFLNTLPLGGAERTFLQLMRVLAARGHKVDLVLARKKGALLNDVPDSVRIVELGKASRLAVMPALLRLAAYPRPAMLAVLRGRLPGVARALPLLQRYLLKERPDALLSTLAYNNLLVLWAAHLCKPSTRVVIREANTLSRDSSAGTDAFDAFIPALVQRWYPRADAIVCVSTGVADDLADTFRIPRQRLITIFNPVDAERVQRLAAEPAEHTWLAPGSPPVLLSVGRLERQKDYPTLLRALAEVRLRREVRLLILGEGTERRALESLVTSLGLEEAVSMPGPSANPHPYMAKAALFVLPSAWEGFPNVLLEALACGSRIVATDCPGGTNELLAGGRFGRLVPVGEPAALSQAILESLDAPHDPNYARSRAADFSLEPTADRYLELLIGRKQPKPHN